MLKQKQKLVPVPLTLRLVLLSDCNFNCTFCHKEGNSTKNKMQLGLVEKLFDFFKGKIKRVCLTGGEPTLYKDILKVVKIGHKNGFTVALTTNGSVYNKELFELLDEIHVSFFTYDEKTFSQITGYSDFKKITRNIRKIVANWVDKLRINKVVLPEDLDGEKLEEYLSFVESLGVKNVSLFSVVGDKKINSISLLKELESFLEARFKKVEEGTTYVLFLKNGMKIYLKRRIFSKMCENCPLVNICEGKCGLRVLPDGFLDVCFYKLFPPLDFYSLKDITPDEVIKYYLDGSVPDSLKGKEYERKYKVVNKERINSLNVIFKGNERYTVDKYWSFDKIKPPKYYVRLREKNGKKRLEFHIVKSRDLTEEYETRVDDFLPIIKLFKELSGDQYIEVSKKRYDLFVTIKDENIRLILDEVDNLGTFIEIEGLSARYLDKIEKYLKFVLNLERIVGKGYPDLLIEKLKRSNVKKPK